MGVEVQCAKKGCILEEPDWKPESVAAGAVLRLPLRLMQVFIHLPDIALPDHELREPDPHKDQHKNSKILQRSL